MSDFDKLLKSKKVIIDKQLKKLFSHYDNYNKMLYKSMEYSVMAGGKRLRPIIVLMVYQMLTNSKKTSDIMPIACAVEMVHTYSLIHDDLPSMDNDDFRRGKPTLHKKYNEGIAILAGDALFSYAIETFLNAKFKAEYVNSALKFFLKEIGPEGIVGGQFVDTNIEYYKRNKNTLSYIHNKKTATLIASCFTLPAILLNKKKEMKKLLQLGQSAGLLFQIIDDILDIESNKKVLGKSIGKDIEQNKLTYITLYGIEKAKNLAQKEYKNAINIAKSLNYNTENIENLINYFQKRIY